MSSYWRGRRGRPEDIGDRDRHPGVILEAAPQSPIEVPRKRSLLAAAGLLMALVTSSPARASIFNDPAGWFKSFSEDPLRISAGAVRDAGIYTAPLGNPYAPGMTIGGGAAYETIRGVENAARGIGEAMETPRVTPPAPAIRNVVAQNNQAPPLTVVAVFQNPGDGRWIVSNPATLPPTGRSLHIQIQ
jgi:hypothetical protein